MPPLPDDQPGPYETTSTPDAARLARRPYHPPLVIESELSESQKDVTPDFDIQHGPFTQLGPS
jgi:hypothetical protein